MKAWLPHGLPRIERSGFEPSRWTLGTLRMKNGDGEDEFYFTVCLYFTLEFRFYLDLFSVSTGIKTCPC